MPGRVLIVGEYGSRNGGENSLLAVLPCLIDLGWEFESLTPVDCEFSNALETAGCQSLNAFSLHESGGTRKPQLTIREELACHFRRIQPAIVHCNSLSTSRLVGPVTREMNLPSLGYLRDILKLSKTAVGDINQLDHIVAVSQATKEWHCDHGIDANKTSVIHNGVDGNVFFPNVDSKTSLPQSPAVFDEFDIPTGTPILLFVGQIGLRKGIEDLVRIFFQVASRIPNVRLLIVGHRHSQKEESIEYERRLRDECQSSGLGSNIHWLGHRNDVAVLMRAASLLVHPARQEPLGRVLLEAASSGLPIVTTNVGGTPEIISRPTHRSALLFESGNQQQMADAIVVLLRDEKQIRTIGGELREMALEHFSIFSCANQLDRCYQRLLTP